MASDGGHRSGVSPGELSKAGRVCPPHPGSALHTESGNPGQPAPISLPPGRKHTPVVEEGTDDFGSDWVELQVRDIVEVLFAVFQDARERQSEESNPQCQPAQAVWRHLLPSPYAPHLVY